MLNTEIDCDLKQSPIHTYTHSTQFKTTALPQSISLLSWNILHKNDAPKKMFPYAHPDHLNWNKRLIKIKNHLSNSNTDIICLQEISKSSFTQDFGTEFAAKYNYSSKVNNNKKTHDSTQAIMYKSSKFICQYEESRSRALITLLTNKLEQSNCIHCKNSKHICIYHSFFIVSAHLNSPRKSDESTRISQIKSILNRINFCVSDKLQLNPNTEINNIRIIIVGDFNCGHESDTSQMLLNGNNNKSFKHKFQFKDAYHEQMLCTIQNYNEYEPNLRIKYFPTYIAHGNIFAIDLMFYIENHFKLKGVTNTLDEEIKSEIHWNEVMDKRINEWIENDKKTNVNGLYHLADQRNILQGPNEKIPSDHLPLAAVFEMNNICEMENENNMECRCCLEKVMKKQNAKNKKRKRNTDKLNENGWKFYEMYSNPHAKSPSLCRHESS
eukprot:543270_1